jgi:hypothetical protein
VPNSRETIVSTIPAPLISEGDYPTFRRLLEKQIPESFAEWKKEADKEDRLVGIGDRVKRVPVTSQDFIGYCHRNGLLPTMHSLRNCAADKYGRQRSLSGSSSEPT